MMISRGRDVQIRRAVSARPARPEPRGVSTGLAVAPGRVEPVSEEINVSAEIGGKLQAVPVEEGSEVRRGRLIALLESGDYRARVASAEAQVVQKEAELRRVINGARDPERREALAAVLEAEALMEQARTEMERRRSLFRTGDTTREEAERAERQYQVAKSRHEAAAQRHGLITDEAREEDRAKAEADVALARALLDEARARFEKTLIRSPITGVVLRKHLKSGEGVSTSWTRGRSFTSASASTIPSRSAVRGSLEHEY